MIPTPMDHVLIRTNTAICFRCNTVLVLLLSEHADTYESDFKTFCARHERCKPRDFQDLDCKGKS